MTLIKSKLFLRLILPALLGGIFLFAVMLPGASVEYNPHATAKKDVATSSRMFLAGTTTDRRAPSPIPELVVTHLKTPEPLYAAYMTSCIASGKKLRAPLVSLIEKTELNGIIIDIKDFTGMVSIDTGDPRFVLNTRGCHIPDIKEFIAELHTKGIYVIGRVTVMQDSVYPKSHPDAAVKRKSNGEIWKDKKGISFIDPGATEYWQYMIDLGKASYALGFDEINYDYIRYPSDGDMSDAAYPRTGSSTKAAMMKKFYAFLGKGMREAGIITSADLFGMTTTNTDDLGIGQVLESALVSFDYVAPMVYPSHYPPYFNGWKDPNMVPYEIIKFAMSRAVTRANELERKEFGTSPFAAMSVGTSTATSTTSLAASSTAPAYVVKGIYANKLRPWIQDFDYGKVYTEADVRAQKRGVYDAKLTSWMTWDPQNKYTPSAYNVSGPLSGIKLEANASSSAQ